MFSKLVIALMVSTIKVMEGPLLLSEPIPVEIGREEETNGQDRESSSSSDRGGIFELESLVDCSELGENELVCADKQLCFLLLSSFRDLLNVDQQLWGPNLVREYRVFGTVASCMEE